MPLRLVRSPAACAVTLTLLLVTLAPASAVAQLVRCELRSPAHEYGLAGECAVLPGQPLPAGRGRAQLGFLWPAHDTVPIFMSSGPLNPPPWRGHLLLPRRSIGFEIALRGGAERGGGLVLRAAPGWVVVREWAAAGETQLIFDLSDFPVADEDDAAILEHALAALDTLTHWNREDDRTCTDDASGGVSLFCLLESSVRWRMGRYHHRQPALEIARAVLWGGWLERLDNHPLMDFNNHPATTREDLRSLLQHSLRRVREEIETSEQSRL